MLACTHGVSSKRSEASTDGIDLPPIGFAVGTTIGGAGGVPLDPEAVVDDLRMTLSVRRSNASRNNEGSVLEEPAVPLLHVSFLPCPFT